MFLVRSVRKTRWETARDGLTDEDLSAWGITLDLRADCNKISLWTCGDGDQEARREAALALAAQGRNEPDRLEIVWFDEEQLRNDGIEVESSRGNTFVTSLVDSHRDLTCINQTRLLKVAKRIVEAFAEGRYERFNPTQVTKMLADAVTSGRLDVNRLKNKLRAAVENEVKKQS